MITKIHKLEINTDERNAELWEAHSIGDVELYKSLAEKYNIKHPYICVINHWKKINREYKINKEIFTNDLKLLKNENIRLKEILIAHNIDVETGLDQNGENLAFLNQHIDYLDLSVRSRNWLYDGGFFKIKDLINATYGEVLKTPNIGRKSVDEVREKLQAFGFDLK